MRRFAGIVVVVVSVSMLVGCSAHGQVGPSPLPPPTSVPTPAPTDAPPSASPTATPEELRPAAVVRLTGRSAAGLAMMGGSLWVSHFEGTTLSEVDMASVRETGTVEVGRHPGPPRPARVTPFR